MAATPADALDASPVVLLSLTDYRAMTQILDGCESRLAGRTLINLSSDTPTRTRAAAGWAGRHGAAFVAGGLMVPAPMIGGEHAYAYFSGDRAAFDEHEALLSSIGQARFLGEDPGMAQLMYQAHLDVFLTVLAGLAHAVALVGTAGISAEAFLPEAMEMFSAIPDMIAEDGAVALGRRIDEGAHADEASTNDMLGASADHVRATAEDVGISTALPGLVQDIYRRARLRGWERDGWTRAVELMRTEHPERPANDLA